MIYGEYEYTNIDIEKLIALPQVRKQKNDKIDELVESIKQNGLINPIDVAIMDYDNFKKHIDFINNLWKTNINCDLYPTIDNLYYVIIAGHTRYQAICKIANEQNSNPKICAKVHKAKTSEEILSIQLDENIHKEPRIEERAIAIIECYNCGLQTSKWNNEEEFVNENKHKFSRNILNDALAFTNLPFEVQAYILNGNTYYQAGVELGKISSLISKYINASLGDNHTLEEFNESLKIEYAIILSNLLKKKSVKKAIDYIHNYKKMRKDFFREKEEVTQEMFDWFNDGIDRQSIEFIKSQQQMIAKLCQELSLNNIENMSNYLLLTTELTGADTTEEQKVLRKISNNYQNRIINNTK